MLQIYGPFRKLKINKICVICTFKIEKEHLNLRSRNLLLIKTHIKRKIHGPDKQNSILLKAVD